MLDGKIIVVTGAGGGIGRGIALAMAVAGARVVVNDLGVSLSGEPAATVRDEAKHPDSKRGAAGSGPATRAGSAQAVVDEIVAAGGQAVSNTDSVSTWAGAHRIVQCALDQFGRIDAVVNNAGNLRDRMFHKMNEEEWRSVIDVHLNGSFFVSRAAANHFRDQEGGSYIHMTSTSGLIGNFGQANYSAAKLGIVGLSKSIALDMARYKVRSNCIAPFAWSRMTDSIPAGTPGEIERVERMKKMQAGRIAPMAVFLASDAALGVNAQIFAVRANEIMLMGQSRPLRSVQMAEGWTPESIATIAIPSMRGSFYKLERSSDVICWDPI